MFEKRRVQTVAGVVLFIGLVFSAVAQTQGWKSSDADSAVDKRYFYDNAKARVQWGEGSIEIRAGATADPGKSANLAHARSMALKTARHLAYEKMLETIKGMSLTSNTVYRDELLSNSTLETRLKGFVSGARVVKEEEKFLQDGSIWVEVTIRQALYGKKSLSAASASTLKTRPKKPHNLFAPKEDTFKKQALYSGYSGLIIDARNLGVRPAVFPNIISPDGRAVYSPEKASQEYILAQGLVGYATSTVRAKEQGRVGKNPLVVKAKRASGPHQANVVVSEEDAIKIFAADIKSKILREARVVFVIN